LKIEENVPLQNNMPGNNSSNLNGITFSWNFVALSLSLSLISLVKIYGICMFHVQSCGHLGCACNLFCR
jgi:hypothetical protein